MNLKFIADIHISPKTVIDLKKSGYQIIRITDKLALTTSDEDIVKYAIKENSIIITQDLDFFRYRDAKRFNQTECHFTASW